MPSTATVPPVAMTTDLLPMCLLPIRTFLSAAILDPARYEIVRLAYPFDIPLKSDTPLHNPEGAATLTVPATAVIPRCLCVPHDEVTR
ncbi:UDP-N-acetylenolpyruvoylglucosamine reductase [Streptomyces sp. NBRC 110611]|nr:UDP-N-acetylenolpyruvoylglucosamine reductase [Streptomyces sp. NBRC 110611]